jgi:hypothetical protein
VFVKWAWPAGAAGLSFGLLPCKERLCEITEAFIYSAMARLMVRRLAHEAFSDGFIAALDGGLHFALRR